MTAVAWIDVMGVDPTSVEATFDEDAQRVLVDEPTRDRMAEAIRAAGIFDDESTANIVRSLRDLPVVDGRVDVTEAGGGFAHWKDQILDG